MNNKFPKDFLWGAATSAYQIEGNNFNSDWWEWEQKGKTKEKSGIACDYWNRYKKDHDLLQELGVNAFRLSLEWSRIEPKEGEFSEEVIRRYREILQDLKNRNIKTVVTFWHWTSPIWFQKKYGWHKRKSINAFLRYGERVINELGDLIDIVVTINEPMVPMGMGFLSGGFPPGYKNPIKFYFAVSHLAEAHRNLYGIIHKKVNIPVGISHLYNYYTSGNGNFLGKIIYWFSKFFRVRLFGRKIEGYQDYFGIDYYRLGKIKFDPKHGQYMWFNIEEDKKNIMGWVTYARGICEVLKEAAKDNELPIYILENGMSDYQGLEDEKRVRFIRDHIKYVEKAIDEGVDVRGYFHWSLMDNFEWLYGYKPRFGLVEIDYKTLERKPRKSFYVYQKIIKNNGI